MKVRITGHSDPITVSKWWYADHIGEVFEVQPDPEWGKYYYTNREWKGKEQKLPILKVDCEEVAG